MPIAEPTNALGLWPKVRAVSGWPEADEDVVRALADGWRDGNSLFTTAGGYPLSGASWTDDAGGAFLTRAQGSLDRAATSAAGMTRVADRAVGYADEVAGVKTGINRLIDANLVPYAAMGLLPAGVREVADGMFVQQVAGVVNQMMTDAAGRVGANPAGNRQYWDSLSLEERQRLIQEQPQLVGSTDGFPATARDQANQLLMTRARTDLRNELADINRQIAASPGGPGNAADVRKLTERRQEIRTELAGINVIQGRLSKGDYFLLGFDLKGAGQDATAIVAKGDPDTAANVATYVPGAESSFAQMGRILGDADAMSSAAGPGSSVIMWLGYDAPPTAADAYVEHYATDGEQALVQFQQGLRASHAGPPSHNTVVAHSYGSVLAGYAARDHGLPVDDFVAVGSPGTGVENASQLGLAPEHVFVVENNGDPIADLGGSGWFGNDPGDADYGAVPLRGGTEPNRPSVVGDYGDAYHAHLGYFYDTGNNPALADIGDVIANRVR